MINNILTKLKSFNKLQTIITISAFVGIFLFFNSLLNNKIYPRINKLEQENQKLLGQIEANNNKISDLSKNIDEKNNRINELEKKDIELEEEYNKNNSEINKLRKKYEKVNSADKFNSTDIKGYFSNEYEN
jgi:chromosome segregation ATPase